MQDINILNLVKKIKIYKDEFNININLSNTKYIQVYTDVIYRMFKA